MIEFSDISQIVADSFFGGDLQLAGLVMFSMALAIMFSISKNAFVTLVLAMPVTFVFSSMGLLADDMLIILIIVIVLGLAYTGRNIWSR